MLIISGDTIATQFEDNLVRADFWKRFFNSLILYIFQWLGHFFRKGMKPSPTGMTSVLGQTNEALRSDMQQKTENLFFLWKVVREPAISLTQWVRWIHIRTSIDIDGFLRSSWVRSCQQIRRLYLTATDPRRTILFFHVLRTYFIITFLPPWM